VNLSTLARPKLKVTVRLARPRWLQGQKRVVRFPDLERTLVLSYAAWILLREALDPEKIEFCDLDQGSSYAHICPRGGRPMPEDP